MPPTAGGRAGRTHLQDRARDAGWGPPGGDPSTGRVQSGYGCHRTREQLQEISDTTGAKSFAAPSAARPRNRLQGHRFAHRSRGQGETGIAYQFAGLGAAAAGDGERGLSLLWFNRFP